jgi:hypothetical protein
MDCTFFFANFPQFVVYQLFLKLYYLSWIGKLAPKNCEIKREKLRELASNEITWRIVREFGTEKNIGSRR